MTETIEYDLKEIIARIKQDTKRAGWSKQQIKDHLDFYYEKDGLLKLTDSELVEFMEFCRNLPTETLIRFRSLQLPSLPPIESTTNRETEIEPAF